MSAKRYKDEPKKKSKKKLAIVLVSVLAACSVAVTGTLAFLTTSTDPVINSFSPANTVISVPENLDEENNIKTDAAVLNQSDIDVYIRARIVVTWKAETAASSGGVDDVLGVAPVLGTDYTYTINTTDWTLGSDGYYYHNTSVGAGDSTNALLTNGIVKTTAPVDGYVLSIEIIASAIQATPATAVTDAWGAANGGSVTAVASNGNLTVTE